MDLRTALLYHYYEAARGPFRSLSDLALDEAEEILDRIRQEGTTFAGRRPPFYLTARREVEQQIRAIFIGKGGKPPRATPHYLILGACPWVNAWYQDGCAVCIPLSTVDPLTVSFTYGDSMPAMRYQDGKPYRGQVYALAELPSVIRRYGLPQAWNAEGHGGPERYIEAQLWDDGPVLPFLGSRG